MRLGSSRWRHGELVGAIAFSRDGKRLASANFGDGWFAIWDAENGKILHRIELKPVTALALSEDGTSLAAITRDLWGAAVWVWKEGTEKPRELIRRTEDARTLLFHKRHLWLGERRGISCWDLDGGTMLVDYKLKTPTRVTALAYYDGARPMVAAATASGVLVITASGENIDDALIAKKEIATTVAFAPDGKSVAVGTDDGALYVWAIKDGILEKRLDFRPHRVGVTSITYSPDGKQLISVCRAGECYRWDAVTGDKVSKVVAKGAPPVAADASFTPALALSPDGKRLAGRFGPTEDKVDRRLHIWNTANGEDFSLAAATGHSSAVQKMAFQSDGSFVSLGETGELFVWNTKFGEVIHRELIPKENVNKTAISAEGRVAFFDEERDIKDVDLKTGKQSPLYPMSRWVYGAAFSPDSNLLVTIYFGRLGLWSVKNKSVTEVDLSMKRVSRLAFSGDGKRMLLADEETIQVLNISTPEKICQLTNVRSDGPIALSANGQLAAIWTTKGGLRFFDANNGQEFPTRNVELAVAHDLAFAPDGHSLVVATDEGVRFLDPITGRELFGHLDGGQGAVTCLAINRDGTLLATGGVDGTVLLWDVRRMLHLGLVAQDGRLPLLPEQRDFLWTELASTDPAISFSASSALFDGGKGTVAFFRDRLLTHKTPVGNEEQRRLLKQLADPDYKERAKAFAALKKIGRAAEPVLREAFRTETDEIMHIRLRAFLSELELDGIVTPKDERTRDLRVVQLLALMGTPPARELLSDLAEKGASKELRDDAQETLKRLKGRAPKD